jgi:hypothetical protein
MLGSYSSANSLLSNILIFNLGFTTHSSQTLSDRSSSKLLLNPWLQSIVLDNNILASGFNLIISRHLVVPIHNLFGCPFL